MDRDRQRMIWQAFSDWRQASPAVAYRTVYADMAADPAGNADPVAGLMLAQLVYWYLLPAGNGGTRARIERDGHRWIARRREDWYDELRIKERQADAKLRRLERQGLIARRVYKFAGTPTMHIRIIREAFLERWYDAVAAAGDLPPLDMPDRGISTLPIEADGPICLGEADTSKLPIEADPFTKKESSEIDLDRIWADASGMLRMCMTRSQFDAQLAKARPARLEHARLVLQAPAGAAEWINTRLRMTVERELRVASDGAIQSVEARTGGGDE